MAVAAIHDRASLRRYLGVGITAFALDYAVFFALWRTGLAGYLTANAAGMLCGFLFSFLLNHRYTFRDSHDARDSAKAFVRFGLANLLSLGLASVVLSLLVQGAGLRADWGKAAVSALVPCWNFLLYRHYVFAECR